ncbi:MAG TPA: hypothetical protein ENL11_03475 [Candidatus Acetothermia bacterium]|nr:hypothetical protein [Candidatus Acetothermia bacterium]
MVKAGAFDRFGPSRKGLLSLVDEGLRLAQLARKERASGQRSFFGVEELVPELPVGEDEFPHGELLKFERELLGLYISGHPLDEHEARLKAAGVVPLAQAEGARGSFRVAGRVKASKVISTNGGRMAFLTLEDKTGEREVVVRDRLYESSPGWFSKDVLLLLTVRWGERNGARRLYAEEAEPLEDLPAAPPARYLVEIPAELVDQPLLDRLAAALADHPGPVPVQVRLWDGTRALVVAAGRRYAVRPGPELRHQLEGLGPGIRVDWE